MGAISGVSPEGALRQADVALRTAGRWITLRLSGLAAGGDDAEQLGLATPAFRDVPFGPVLFERAGAVTKLLVAASAVLQQVQSLAFESAEVLFETAVGLVIDGDLYVIAQSEPQQAGGTTVCYWLTLQAPAR